MANNEWCFVGSNDTCFVTRCVKIFQIVQNLNTPRKHVELKNYFLPLKEENQDKNIPITPSPPAKTAHLSPYNKVLLFYILRTKLSCEENMRKK